MKGFVLRLCGGIFCILAGNLLGGFSTYLVGELVFDRLIFNQGGGIGWQNLVWVALLAFVLSQIALWVIDAGFSLLVGVSRPRHISVTFFFVSRWREVTVCWSQPDVYNVLKVMKWGFGGLTVVTLAASLWILHQAIRGELSIVWLCFGIFPVLSFSDLALKSSDLYKQYCQPV